MTREDKRMNTVIIGIAGGSSSGKTTITKKLKEKFKDSVSIVYHDNYYKSNDNLPMSERVLINYDSPEAFETELMVEHLKSLLDGKGVDCPVYDYSVHNRTDRTVRIEPAEVIIVEGILVLQSRQLRELMDIKIFVDTDADERIMRRIQRDVCERNRELESVMRQYRDTVKPMHEKYIEPSKKYADIIVVGGGRNQVALSLINAWVASSIHNS